MKNVAKALPSRPASAITLSLLGLLMQAAHAELPFDPPGTYTTSWLGNTYMDAAGHKNVTEEIVDLCLSSNGKHFTAGYAETWGGGAECQAGNGGFIARYDRLNRVLATPGQSRGCGYAICFLGGLRAKAS